MRDACDLYVVTLQAEGSQVGWNHTRIVWPLMDLSCTYVTEICELGTYADEICL